MESSAHMHIQHEADLHQRASMPADACMITLHCRFKLCHFSEVEACFTVPTSIFGRDNLKPCIACILDVKGQAPVSIVEAYDHVESVGIWSASLPVVATRALVMCAACSTAVDQADNGCTSDHKATIAQRPGSAACLMQGAKQNKGLTAGLDMQRSPSYMTFVPAPNTEN